MARNLRNRKEICSGKITKDKKSGEENLPSDNPTIEILNDDCLLHIFQYLPIRDRIRLERVSKRWCDVSRMSWRRFKVLNFTHRLWGHGVTITRKILKDVLNRCSQLLEVWDMSEMSVVFKEPWMHVKSFLKFCPNLKSIDLTSIITGQAEITSIVGYCKKLVILKLGAISCFVPNWFTNGIVLSALPNLQVLHIGLIREYIHHPTSLSGNWINFKNKNSITELRLDYCRGLDASNIFTAVPQLPNLHTLSLRGSLDFWSVPWNIYFIAHSNIKTLDISGNPSSIDDNFLLKIAMACERLTSLYIGENPKVTDAGLSALILSSNLEYLNINRLNITGTSLSDFLPLLEQLSCKYCKRLNAKNFLSLFKNSDRLKCMNLQGVTNVDNIVRVAIEYLKSCENHVTISIFLDEVDVHITEIPENLKLLKLHND